MPEEKQHLAGWEEASGKLAGLTSQGVTGERTGTLAKPAFAIQQSLLPSEVILCSSNSLNSYLIFNNGPISRAVFRPSDKLIKDEWQAKQYSFIFTLKEI